MSKRTIVEIKADKSGNRTPAEVKRLDEANTRKGKLYRSVMAKKKSKQRKKLSDTDSFQRVTKTGKYKVKKRKIHTKTGNIIEKKKVDGGYIW